jgi:phosphopantothenoylcysteine decarboxylase/phosphopantothenate--cysteine ligase
MAAAVADWRPRRQLTGKWRKKDEGGDTATLQLVRNPDILAEVAAKKGSRLVVGFALETGSGVRRATAKLVRKNADYIVLNDAGALNADRTTVTMIAKDGTQRRLEDRPKREVAEALVDLAARWPRAPS